MSSYRIIAAMTFFCILLGSMTFSNPPQWCVNAYYSKIMNMPSTLTAYVGEETSFELQIYVGTESIYSHGPSFVNVFVGVLSDIDLTDETYTDN